VFVQEVELPIWWSQLKSNLKLYKIWHNSRESERKDSFIKYNMFWKINVRIVNGYAYICILSTWVTKKNIWPKFRAEHFRFGPVLNQNQQPNRFFLFFESNRTKLKTGSNWLISIRFRSFFSFPNWFKPNGPLPKLPSVLDHWLGLMWLLRKQYSSPQNVVLLSPTNSAEEIASFQEGLFILFLLWNKRTCLKKNVGLY
jgi:hypothetical protein